MKLKLKNFIEMFCTELIYFEDFILLFFIDKEFNVIFALRSSFKGLQLFMTSGLYFSDHMNNPFKLYFLGTSIIKKLS